MNAVTAHSAFAHTLPAPKARAPKADWQLSFWKVALFIAAHVLLALAMKKAPILATVHGWSALFFGLYLALSGRPREQVVAVAAYIVGAEVLWRMTGARVFWEMGKYSVSLLFVASMLRQHRAPTGRAVLYLLLMSPSLLMTFSEESLDNARNYVSYNFSGPAALGVCWMFLKDFKITRPQLFKIMLAALAPAAGIAAIAFLGIATTTVKFGRNSNLEASGGFGPNQVSSALGLGILAAFICFMDDRTRRGLKPLFLVVMMAMAAQAALTFSRTGLYLGIGCSCLASIFLVRNRRVFGSILVGGTVVALLAWFVVLPRLNDLTGGHLEDRLKNTSTTGRDVVMREDLNIFMRFPVLGTGPGRAREYRDKYWAGIAAHTEYTRMLAEHGILGLMALVVMGIEVLTAWTRAKGSWNKALVSAFFAFALLFMMATGMRLAAPCLMFGLAAGLRLVDGPRLRRLIPVPGGQPLLPAPMPA